MLGEWLFDINLSLICPLIFQLFSVASFSRSNLLIQCVPGLIVQDYAPISVGILFGLTNVSKFCCKLWLIIVEC